MGYCTALTKKGQRCKNEAKADGKCTVHLRIADLKKSFLQRHQEPLKALGAAAGATGGLFSLIKACIELWNALPFGPAPKRPTEFRELSAAVLGPGPHYPDSLPSVHIPYNKSHEEMDWTLLLHIYRESLTMQDNSMAGIAEQFEEWFASRPEPFQTLLNYKLEEETDRASL